MQNKKILLSGGSGLLGMKIQEIDSSVIAPSHSEMDILNKASIEAALDKYSPDVFIHAAAFTSPPKINEDPILALETNIIGTANVVSACKNKNVRLVYISTDYVFKGDKGNYREDSELLPQNKYAWSKLGGECAVKLYDNSLIIRTTFSPDIFPYEKAFSDQFTSRDIVSVIAPIILKASLSDATDTIHVGTEKKSVLDLARQSKPDVGELKRAEVTFAIPEDTSFELTKLSSLNS